jgi:hypothetical protein
MARKVIGPTGSRRRRWLFLCTSILTVAAAVLFIAGAAAGTNLYNSGMFELDGNTLVNSPPNAVPPAAGGTACANPWPAVATTGGDDWAGLYHNRATAGANGGPCSSNAFTFVNDGIGGTSGTDKTYWSGGGSKDAYDPALGPWQWASNDVSPDKNDLVNAFAAIYTNPGTQEQDLYFGSDRYTTNGDAQQGFQFLQNAACLAGSGAPANAACPGTTPTTFPNTCTPSVSGSNAGWFVNPSTGCPVHHKDGDLLILVNFNNGGTLGLAGVYEWTCAAGGCATGGSYTQQLVGTGADCKTLTPGKSFCATSNTVNLTNEPVWPYQAKGQTGQATYTPSAFVEGGVDLAAIPGAGTCFPTFVAESRSSAGPSSGLSLQAQLKDLVFGRFQLCGANVTTAASADGTTVTPGTQVRDTATVSGTGTVKPTPTGSVDFYLCGPSASANPTCAATTDGTKIGTASLSGSGGTATATSPYVNCAADGSGCTTGLSQNPLANGYYCFLAVYGGDSNYTSPPYINSDETHECFRVLQIGTGTVTTPQQGGSNIGSGGVVFGTQVTDHAVVTALTSGGGDVTGTVSFFLCSPSDMANATPVETTCDTGGTAASGNPVALTPGTPVPPANPFSTADSTLPQTVDQVGTWCWRAVYNPTGNVYTTSSDHSSGECFTVHKIGTGTVTTPQQGGSNIGSGGVVLGSTVTDHAVVTALTSEDGNINGTVSFFLCSPSDMANATPVETTCDTGGSAASGNPVALTPGTPVGPLFLPFSTADSTAAQTVNQTGTWCFRAVFTPATGSPYTGSSDHSSGECFTVHNIGTGTVTTPQQGGSNIGSGGVVFGTTVTDHAVVTALTSEDGDINGTVSFFLCSPSDMANATPVETTCDTGGSAASGNPVTLTPGTPVGPLFLPFSTADSTAAQTVNQLGTWCFRAVFTPATGSPYTGSSDHSSGECFNVTDTTTGSSAQTWRPQDSASVSSQHGAPLSGTLTIQLYADADCGASQGESGDAVSGQVYTNGPFTGASSPQTVSSNNTSYSVSSSTSVSWLETFSSSNTNLGSFSHCETTSLTITN